MVAQRPHSASGRGCKPELAGEAAAKLSEPASKYKGFIGLTRGIGKPEAELEYASAGRDRHVSPGSTPPLCPSRPTALCPAPLSSRSDAAIFDHFLQPYGCPQAASLQAGGQGAHADTSNLAQIKAATRVQEQGAHKPTAESRVSHMDQIIRTSSRGDLQQASQLAVARSAGNASSSFQLHGGGQLQIPRMSSTQQSVFSASFAATVLSQPIVVVDNFLASCGTNNSAFSVETLQRQCSEASADILHQPCAPDCGWNLPLQSSYQMEIGRYLSYVRSCVKGRGPLLCVDYGEENWVDFVLNPRTLKHYSSFTHASLAGKLRKQYKQSTGKAMHLPMHPSGSAEVITPETAATLGLNDVSKPHVQYAVNIDLKGNMWKHQTVALRESLPPWMAACGVADAFRLSPQKVDGMNCPQLYIKVAGSWTGTHEENNRFYSVNHNHGPSPSEWGAIAPQHVAKLRRAVLAEVGVDILAAEGRYIPDRKFCAKHCIPVMVGRQNAGDTVLLQGGTLHWVKAMGVSVHSSWNYAPFRAETFQAALARRNINTSMRPAYPSYVPVATLCLNVARELISSEPLKSLSLRNVERVLLETALAEDAHYQPNMHAPSSILQLPGAARTLPELLRLVHVLLQELQAQLLRQEAHEAAVRRAHVPLEREPPLSQVYRCQNVHCHAELFSVYVLCETCHGVGQSAFNVAAKSGKAAEGDSPHGSQHTTAFYVTPPPGRTDVAADVQAKLCVPSLVGVDTAKSMGAGGARKAHIGTQSGLARLDGRRKRRRAWHEGDFAATGAVTCAPIMCVPCALSHACSTGGGHHLHAMFKFRGSTVSRVIRRLQEVSELLSAAVQAQTGSGSCCASHA